MMAKLKYPASPILMVDDEPDLVDSLEVSCRLDGLNHIIKCTSPIEALKIVNTQRISIVLLDLNMPELSGEELLPRITQNFPEIPVVIVSGFDDLDRAVTCMKHGAADYLVKPVEPLQLTKTIRQQLEIRQLKEEVSGLNQGMFQDELCMPEAFNAIVTQSDAMFKVFQYVETIAPSPKPVLVTGETGTGKELIAQAIHECSQRPGELICLNVAGLDENSFSDALFGHLKGAFTGAENYRDGAIKRAAGGTLFLDEIGDLKESLQVKLLRVIQENEYTPLGSDVPKKCDVRIVACTNYSVDQLLELGKLRKDFFYRIGTHRIVIPPLRERLDDIPLLVSHFIRNSAEVLGKKLQPNTDKIVSLLMNYSFPGNVRELEGMIFDAVGKSNAGKIPLDSFLMHLKRFSDEVTSIEAAEGQAEVEHEWPGCFRTLPSLKRGTELLVEEALRRADGNQSMAASMLGISRQALNRRLSNKK